MNRRRQIAILASGDGSNMAAIAKSCRDDGLSADIALVLSNEPESRVLDRARDLNLRHCCVCHRDFADRPQFEAAVQAELQAVQADLVVLAGFMRILTSGFVREYYGSLLNIHPSLLPKYTGLNTHQRALDAGDHEAGASVHFVTPELDAGPTIAQVRVAVQRGDTADTLAQRVLQQEHRLYPQAVRWCVEGRVILKDGCAWKDGEPLGTTGVLLDAAAL